MRNNQVSSLWWNSDRFHDRQLKIELKIKSYDRLWVWKFTEFPGLVSKENNIVFRRRQHYLQNRIKYQTSKSTHICLSWLGNQTWLNFPVKMWNSSSPKTVRKRNSMEKSHHLCPPSLTVESAYQGENITSLASEYYRFETQRIAAPN